ncbi:MAG: AAA family ATPase [Bacteroidales bacterium]|nr:AAA family ATPase [Bacteroidales bacterium]
MIFKRKIYSKLLDWKKTAKGKRALVIKGARRVGKSTIVKEFAKNEYKSFIFIDFAEASKRTKELFEDISDLNFLFVQLQMIYKVQLFERQSVIIFDEVQLVPLARQAIKYLVADGRYDYIETGSLIGIRKYMTNIVIPSEETTINMFPLDFEEFRWALGDTVTVPLLKQCFDSQKPIGEVVTREIIRNFRLYMLIGGMPQAVNEYIETNNFACVDEMKRTILNLYETDLVKIDTTGRASLMFKNIASQLSHGGSRFKVSSVIENGRAETILSVLNDMEASMMVNVAYHCDEPNIGMSLSKNIEKFKLYLNDTGLFVTSIYKDSDAVDNKIYEKILSDKLEANLGYIYKNIVAQTLRSMGKELFYYTFPAENSNHNYEIDFLINNSNKICPLEVKSSGYKKHTSIDEFSKKYSSCIKNKYVVYTKDLKKDLDIIYLPIFMLQFL